MQRIVRFVSYLCVCVFFFFGTTVTNYLDVCMKSLFFVDCDFSIWAGDYFRDVCRVAYLSLVKKINCNNFKLYRNDVTQNSK